MWQSWDLECEFGGSVAATPAADCEGRVTLASFSPIPSLHRSQGMSTCRQSRLRRRDSHLAHHARGRCREAGSTSGSAVGRVEFSAVDQAGLPLASRSDNHKANPEGNSHLKHVHQQDVG